MTRSFFTLIFLLGSLGLAQAQQNYDVSLIQKSLLPYASAMVRYSDESIQVTDINYQVYHIKKAITIFNNSGDDAAEILVWHDKTSSIKYIKGFVYDGTGKLISKFNDRSFEDAYAGHDFSLFEDTRVMHFKPAVTEYPYTIEYEYEIKDKQTLAFNSWVPANETNMAIEKSTFSFICKPDFAIRYKEINMPGTVQTSVNKEGLKTYTWQISNVKATRTEPYSPNPEKFLAMVKIAPVNFKHGVLTGTFNNWNELGGWMYNKLLAGRQALPPQTVATIKDLTNNISDEKLRAKKVYEFMQQHTRYISVQVGIGGFQPFAAADVDRLNYGDCKGLVNYTQALLAAAGINSYYCVVQAGSKKVSMDTDFASINQGNHIILCIPFKNDTTWLECTNQKMPFGYLGDFTDDRIVLACTPEGGKLMHTPKYTTEDNLLTRKATFTLSETGVLTGSMQTVYKGTQYENQESLTQESPADQLKEISKVYPINNLDVSKLQLIQNKSAQPYLTEDMLFSARDYASVSNGKLYFTPNVANRSKSSLRELRTRTNEVCIQRGYTDEDEIVYTLPAGYKQEKQPLNILINKPFGKYSAKLSMAGDKLVYKRRIQLIDGTYPKENYAELVKFFQDVIDADNFNVSLVKQ